MPRTKLTQAFADNPPAPEPNKARIDYFDTQLAGFFLEVRASGRATYYQRYRDMYGRLRQAHIGPADAMPIEKARQKARQVKSQTTAGHDPNAAAEKRKNIPTVKSFAENQYLPHVKLYKRSWDLDRQMLTQHILPGLGRIKLSDITRDQIQTLQAGLIEAGYKPGTVNRVMALVKYIFNLAVKWEIIPKSPADGVAQLAENNQKERCLTREETDRLLTALQTCKSSVVPDLIEFLILTGARKGEAKHMRWADVDFEKRIWTVPLSKSGKARHIPLSKAAVRLLKKRRGNKSDYVFPSPKTGKPLARFYTTWDKIRIKAGLPDVRIHDLRHNFASLLINNGRSLYEVQKLLGHANIATTQRYAHLSQNTLQEATELVSASLASEDDHKAD